MPWIGNVFCIYQLVVNFQKLRKLHDTLEFEFGSLEKRTCNVCLRRQRQIQIQTKKTTNKDQQRPTKTNKDKQRQIQYGKVESDSRAGNVCLKRQKLDNGLVASSQQKLSVTLGKQVRH